MSQRTFAFLTRSRRRSARSASSTPRPRPTCRPRLDRLEDRLPPGEAFLGWLTFGPLGLDAGLHDPRAEPPPRDARPALVDEEEEIVRIVSVGPLFRQVEPDRAHSVDPFRPADAVPDQGSDDFLAWLQAAVPTFQLGSTPTTTSVAPAGAGIGLPAPNSAPISVLPDLHGGAGRTTDGADGDGAVLLGSGVPEATTTPVTEGTKAQVQENYGRLPLSFEANHGQTDERVDFLARGSGYTLFLSANEAVLSLTQRTATRNTFEPRQPGQVEEPENVRSLAVRMQVLGANAEAPVIGQEQLPGIVNYFLGNDPSKWRTGIPTFGRVEYDDVYPGIDLAYYGTAQSQLEYDFIVAPGANPDTIALNFEGADRVEVDAAGDLVLHASGTQVRQQAPVLYQEIGGQRRAVAGGYVLEGAGRIGFQVGTYDASRPLVIDPVLSYSTYIGGSGEDAGGGIAVDAAGSAYVIGGTESTDFPTTPGALQPSYAGGDFYGDAFVAKLSPDGRALAYATYLGGSAGDGGFDLALDAAGNAYLSGFTTSTNFPTTPGALQPVYRGGYDAFVAKLTADGRALAYSTYLGGSSYEYGTGIVVDATGSAYVTGGTWSSNFPTTPGVIQPAYGGGGSDGYVAKLSADGRALAYSTYLGGSDDDGGTDIAVDAAGNAWVGGATSSANIPTTPGALQPAYAGGGDALVAQLSADGRALVYATYFGGGGWDEAHDIVMDAAGSLYLSGWTSSANLPTTPGALQPAHAGGGDAYVAKLSADGRALIYSTYLGGSGEDRAYSLAVDVTGSAYLNGTTRSVNFPTTPAALQPAYGGGFRDGFVAKLSGDGRALAYSTYLGGSDDDYSHSLAVNAAGSAYVTGYTLSTNFPTTPGVLQPAYGGGSFDAFVAKIAEPIAATATHFTLTNSTSSVVAGAPLSVTVTARDATGAVVPGYGGTVRFSSSDGQATLPADYTFTADDAGVHTFDLTLRTAGSQTVSVTDVASGTLTGSASITVSPAAPASFYVYVSAVVTAGVPFDLWVGVLDAYGNLVTDYAGTVYFASTTDPLAVLPAEYTYAPPHDGWAPFLGGATYFTPGVHDLWVWDPLGELYGVATVTVTAA